MTWFIVLVLPSHVHANLIKPEFSYLYDVIIIPVLLKVFMQFKLDIWWEYVLQIVPCCVNMWDLSFTFGKIYTL